MTPISRVEIRMDSPQSLRGLQIPVAHALQAFCQAVASLNAFPKHWSAYALHLLSLTVRPELQERLFQGATVDAPKATELWRTALQSAAAGGEEGPYLARDRHVLQVVESANRLHPPGSSAELEAPIVFIPAEGHPRLMLSVSPDGRSAILAVGRISDSKEPRDPLPPEAFITSFLDSHWVQPIPRRPGDMHRQEDHRVHLGADADKVDFVVRIHYDVETTA